MTKDKVAAMCLRLPAKDRADLAADLLLSLEESTDDNAEDLWRKEISRRMKLYRQGRYKERSAESVLRKAKARLR